jgi:RimJ/RimL family protein N-acetyltransferase
MNEHPLQIRALSAQDASAFKELRLQAIADAPTAVWPTAQEEAARTVEEVGARIARTADLVVFGAFAGERLVGIAGFRREPLMQVAHKALLWGVFVAPGYRRHGLARQLIDRVTAHARASGVLQLHLAVNTENVRARSLYLQLGFASFGVEPRSMRVGTRFYDEEHMVLRLGDGPVVG